MRALTLVAALLLAACDAPAPRVDTAGEAARKVMDEATARLSECVDREAAAAPVEGRSAGAVAQEVMAACRAERAALVERVQEFRVIGYPKEEAERRRVIAESSVAAIETTLRQQAVTTTITRQMALRSGDAPAGATAPAPQAK
jgi:hypothetical protein